MRSSHDVIWRIKGDIGDAITAWEHARAEAGRPPADDELRVRGEAMIRERLEAHGRERLAAGMARLEEHEEDAIAERVSSLLFGLGGLDRYLADTEVENLFVNGCDRVFFTTSDGRRHEGQPVADSDDELVELIRRLAARSGRNERRFDDAQPRLNLRLADGSRLHALMRVSARPSLTIRRHRHPKVTLADLAGMGAITPPVQAVLGAAVGRPFPLNIVVAGGTDTGKTTMLRALLHQVPEWERLVVIEDSLELNLDGDRSTNRNVVELETREANVEGAGELSMRDLAREALRMAADRVIVGEVRGGEVLEMLQAMNQGNDGSMCTLHADSSAAVFSKICTYALMAREQVPIEATCRTIANSIHLVVHLRKLADGARVVSSIREVTGADGAMVVSNEVFAPDRHGRARLATPFSERTLERLVANGLDHSALQERR